uniref:SynN domain-containing protein n=1 Tax=Strongyloides venezuelensis TaxID=75913 RepID=A0A0K0G6B0_STRVS
MNSQKGEDQKKFDDDVIAKTVAMFQKVEELNQRMAMCEKRMDNVMAKEMKEKSSTMKKKVDNTRAVINDVGKQLTALRRIFDRDQ